MAAPNRYVMCGRTSATLNGKTLSARTVSRSVSMAKGWSRKTFAASECSARDTRCPSACVAPCETLADMVAAAGDVGIAPDLLILPAEIRETFDVAHAAGLRVEYAEAIALANGETTQALELDGCKLAILTVAGAATGNLVFDGFEVQVADDARIRKHMWNSTAYMRAVIIAPENVLVFKLE